jgi:protein SCO1/2
VKRLRAALATVLLGAAAGAWAQEALAPVDGPPVAPAPAGPGAVLTQRIGAFVPPGLSFLGADGRPQRLGASFGGPPVILVPGYYRCPQLCGLFAQGLLEALRASGLPADASRIVFVSIDPDETSTDAAARLRRGRDYARLLAGDGGAAAPDLRALTGSPASIAALTDALGFGWRRSTDEAARAAGAHFAHPATAVVLTPAGRISRYLTGMRFDPQALRAALVEAGEGRVGSLAERVALQCAHVDPRLGRHSTAVLGGVRALGLATLLAVAGFAWRRRGATRGRSAA